LRLNKNASEYDEGGKVGGKGMEKRSAGGGFYLSDLHFYCTDAALFRRIIITLLGARAREGETVFTHGGEKQETTVRFVH